MRGKDHYMTEAEARAIKDPSERETALLLIQAGMLVKPGGTIKSKNPVADKNGRILKTVTNPDLVVGLPGTNRQKHVEVTKGNGNLPHKLAQQRVVDAAGLHDNYVVLTGRERRLLKLASYFGFLEPVVLSILGWED